MKKKNLFLVKLAAVTMMLGFFSPSASFVSTDSQGVNRYGASPFELSISLLSVAEARGARGGGMNRGRSMNRGAGVRRNTNINRNVNVNHYYGGGGHYGYWGGRTVVAWSSALVIGSMVAAASMPTTCTTFITNGVTYKQCGSSYYHPYYQGDTVVYKVVSSPY